MKRRVHTLCPQCDACPEVSIGSDGTVEIGEAGNLVTLKAEEWNELVRLVRLGALGEVVRG